MANGRCVLVALDFDHTMIEENSDLYVKRLAPNGKLPKEIEALFKLTGWTEYMGAIFEYLHSSGVRKEDLQKCMEEIPITSGIKELLQYCQDQHYETIVISDSNSIFIDMILSHANMSGMVNRVFTNPAHFDENGCLRIEYYHTQDWCDLSTINLCKGRILQTYIQERREMGKTFDSVWYVGDGTNDFCPSLTLQENDVVCARIGFKLWKKIQKLKEDSQNNTENKQPDSKNNTENKIPQLKAQILNWKTGFDILSRMKQCSHVNDKC